MASESQVWFAERGEDASIVLSGDTNPSGWTLQTRVLDYPGQSPSVLNVTPTTSGSGPYLITTALTAAQTTALTEPIYLVQLWRTDSGSTVLLASGTLVLGPVILTPDQWAAGTGTTVTGADALALANICLSVNDALQRVLLPFVPVPLTITDEILDAPLTRDLRTLHRPIRSITSLYLNLAANGVVANFTTSDLQVAGTDYQLRVDSREGWGRSGIVRRLGGGVWGVGRFGIPTTLAPTVEGVRDAVKITYAAGPLAVPADIAEAAKFAITLLWKRRTEGTTFASESWNGRAQSLASQVAAMAAIQSPEVQALLAPYLTPKFAVS